MNKFCLITPSVGNSVFADSLVDTVPADIPWLVVARDSCVDWFKRSHATCLYEPDHLRGGGMYRALNFGLNTAGGWDWFSYINDDDLLGPGFGELIRLHCVPGNERVIAFGRVAMIGESGSYLYDFPTTGCVRDFPSLWPSGVVPFTQQGVVASRHVWEALGGFDEAYRYSGDLDFWVRAHLANFKFRFYDLPVASWRIRGGQQSSNLKEVERETGRCLKNGFPDHALGVRQRWAILKFRLMNLRNYVNRFRRLGRLRQSSVFE